MQSDSKLRSSQLATAISTLIEYDTQEVKHLTKADTINFTLLRKRKTVLFLKTPVLSGSHTNLVTIFFRQLFNYLLSTPVSKVDYPLYCLMDEFGNLGKIGRDNDFVQALTLLRSQKVSLSLILQDISQLHSVYGSHQAKAILSGCGHILAYPGIRGDSVTYVSQQLGTSTFTFQEQDKQKRIARPLQTTTEIREMTYGLCLPSSTQASQFTLYPIFKQRCLMRKAKLLSRNSQILAKIPPHLPQRNTQPLQILQLANEPEKEVLSFDERLAQLLLKQNK